MKHNGVKGSSRDAREIQSVIEIITPEEVICCVYGDENARFYADRLREENCDLEVEVYKYLDYVKLHPDFEERYWQSMRDNDMFRGE